MDAKRLIVHRFGLRGRPLDRAMREATWSDARVRRALRDFRVIDHDAHRERQRCLALTGVSGLATAITTARGDVVACQVGWSNARQMRTWLKEVQEARPRFQELLAATTDADQLELARLRSALGAKHVARRALENVYSRAAVTSRGACAALLAELAIANGEVLVARKWASKSKSLGLATRMRIALHDARPAEALALFKKQAVEKQTVIGREARLLAAMARHELGHDANARAELEQLIQGNEHDRVAQRARDELRHLDEPGHEHGLDGSDLNPATKQQ